MSRLGVYICLLVMMAAMTGCASEPVTREQPAGFSSSESPGKEGGVSENNKANGRMLVWNAYLTVEVDDVKIGMDKSADIAQKLGGYIESSSGDGESTGSMVMRIPISSFQDAIKSTQILGKCTSTQIMSKDVTDQYVDTQARLKSKVELRDRLRKLLDRATDVKDVIAIESELTRLQGEIESMEGTIKTLQGQIDYGTINVNFERKTILGPIGFVFEGIWWGVKKLFVLRD